MRDREIDENWRQLEAAFINEILKAKARFIHGCLKRLMPPELYAKAKASKALAECQEWATREGLRWNELKGETLLLRNNVIIGRFRPVIVGEKEEKHCEFLAFLLGEQLNVMDRQPVLN